MSTKQSIQQRRWNRIKTASWLIIPALIMVGVVEHNSRESRESRVKADFARLDQRGTDEEAQAVEALVEGCKAKQWSPWLPSYLAERLFGNCRSLSQAPLTGANLHDANLSYADLRNANLRNADLSYANLNHADLRNADLRNANLSYASISDADFSDADLSNANLAKAYLSDADFSDADLSDVDLNYTYLSDADFSNADLSYTIFQNAGFDNTDFSNADLSNADLSSAYLSGTILSNAILNDALVLNTDIRMNQELTQQQLEGNAPPLICNSLLPEGIEIDKNRDCDRLASALLARYPEEFESIEVARIFVNRKRQQRWE